MKPQARLKTVFSLLTILLMATANAQTNVYKSVDKYGNVTYTDDPGTAHKSGKTEKLNVRPTNVMPATKAIEPAQPMPETEAAKSDQPKYAIRIVSPVHEYTVNPGQRDLVVAVSLQAPLKNGAKIAFYMDGKLLGKGTVNNYSIREILRGEHTIYAQVEDPAGKALSKSASVTVYVHRVSTIGN
ncbi:DUF4124 domain-containing protein [Gilvimarinus polysaccharolyticus]|uniref:DUF4124 domain-containing protein n=1 Tax=Gilvimarinus polysaccharolyticus TaxID=863921 RepID=UPI000673A355|nr:DUF4124 domain-containing protein [Gilvimarinus polysaccharolyticus]